MDRRDRDLTLQFALRDFKIRYTNSALGYAWSVLNPLLFTLIYFLVFSTFIRFNVPNYPGHLLLGIVIWNFFAEGSGNGVASLLARAGLLSKASIRREIVVYAAVLHAFLTFVINPLVLAGVLYLTGTPAHWSALLFPLLLADLVALTLGVALLLSPLHVRFHDVGYLWGILLQVGFWLTPIIYMEPMMPTRWRWLVRYNPMARIVEQSRQAIIYGEWPDALALVRTSVIALVILGVGWAVFRRLQARVVEYF